MLAPKLSQLANKVHITCLPLIVEPPRNLLKECLLRIREILYPSRRGIWRTTPLQYLKPNNLRSTLEYQLTVFAVFANKLPRSRQQSLLSALVVFSFFSLFQIPNARGKFNILCMRREKSVVLNLSDYLSNVGY